MTRLSPYSVSDTNEWFLFRVSLCDWKQGLFCHSFTVGKSQLSSAEVVDIEYNICSKSVLKIKQRSCK